MTVIHLVDRHCRTNPILPRQMMMTMTERSDEYPHSSRSGSSWNGVLFYFQKQEEQDLLISSFSSVVLTWRQYPPPLLPNSFLLWCSLPVVMETAVAQLTVEFEEENQLEMTCPFQYQLTPHCCNWWTAREKESLVRAPLAFAAVLVVVRWIFQLDGELQVMMGAPLRRNRASGWWSRPFLCLWRCTLIGRESSVSSAVGCWWRWPDQARMDVRS